MTDPVGRSASFAWIYVAMSLGIAAQTPDEPRLIARVTQNALQYSEQLPNFICKQVTRRSFDPRGDGHWQEVDESSQLISFYNGTEHYQRLSSRKLSHDGDLFQPWMNSTGEFGSLLRQIFTPEAAARFSRLSSDPIGGREVQTFTYEVDFKHSKYDIFWREGGRPAGVKDAYQGLLSIDPENLSGRRLTLDVQPLPAPFPVRNVNLTLDYGDADVAGKLYNLPLAFTMVVELQKGGRLRNEVTFKDYQRFATNSRLIPDRIP